MSSRDLLMAAGQDDEDKLFVEDVFSTYLYDGNGSAQYINNGIALASTAEWSAVKFSEGAYTGGYGVAADSSGNKYSSGYAEDGTRSYALVAKYNNSGVLQWQRKIYQGSFSLSYSVAVDSSGSVYSIGYANDGGRDYNLIVKYNASGTLQWQRKVYRGFGVDFSDIAIDSSGGVYVVFRISDSSVTGTDIGVVAKYNDTGTLQWQRNVYQNSGSRLLGVAVDGSSNVYITGSTNDGTRTYVIVAKYNTSGTLQWQRKIYQGSSSEGFGVAVDSSDNVYVAGRARDGSDEYALLVKYNSSGTLQWQRRVSQAANTEWYSVAVDGAGNAYVTGRTFVGGFQSQAYDVAIIAKYNTSGTLQWARGVANNSARAYGYGVAVGADGNIHVTGEAADDFAYTTSFGFLLTLKQDGSTVSGTAVVDMFDASGLLTDAAGTATDEAGTATDEAGTAIDEAGTATDEAGTAVHQLAVQPEVEGQGGLVWVKSRTSTQGHFLVDTGRGSDKTFISGTEGNDGQQTITNGAVSFLANGVSYVGGDIYGSNSSANENGTTYASWTFRKAPKFFDIVTFTTDGAGDATVNHGLDSVPGCAFFKALDRSEDWFVYHRSLGGNTYLTLNTTNSATSFGGDPWVTFSSTQLSVNNQLLSVNTPYVAYLFAHDAGGFGNDGTESVIACGTFTSDGSANATIDLGWEPQWLFLLDPTQFSGRYMLDTMRGWTAPNGDFQVLQAEEAAAEYTGTGVYVNATGFSVDVGWWAPNLQGIYIAIRRGPMRVPTDATTVFEPVSQAGQGFVSTGFPVDTAISATTTAFTDSRVVFDRLRGSSLSGGQYLLTDKTDAEGTAGGAFGFDNNIGYPCDLYGTQNIIYWNFRRAPGFFDVVCFTATSGTSTQDHNLTVEPELILLKRRDGTEAWSVGSKVLNSGVWGDFSLELNTNNAAFDNAYTWLSATNTQFQTFGGWLNNNSTYAAYLFATCPGVSKVGTYTGTGSTLQINCSFTTGARFILIKRTDSTGDWYVYDTARGIVSGDDPYLTLNTTATEVTNTDWVDPYAPGFELSNVGGNNVNINGATYIFLAVA